MNAKFVSIEKINYFGIYLIKSLREIDVTVIFV
jgi:hypothetical protein